MQRSVRNMPVHREQLNRWRHPACLAVLRREVSQKPKSGKYRRARPGFEPKGVSVRPACALRAVLPAILLPPVLMMGRSVADASLAAGTVPRSTLNFLGDPIMALMLALPYTITRPENLGQSFALKSCQQVA